MTAPILTTNFRPRSAGAGGIPPGRRGVRLCRVAIFHRDPDHVDSFMEQLESEARHKWSGTFVGRDNMEVTLD